MFGHDAARTFATPDGCSSVSPLTAPTLAPKWYFNAPDAVSASPAIVENKVYVGDWAGNFYRFDAEDVTGSPEKTFDVEHNDIAPDTSPIGFGRIVSSAAVADVDGRRIVLFGGGATLYALDASTFAYIDSVCVDSRAVTAEQRCKKGTGTAAREVEIESSPAVVHEADGTTSVLVGMDVHNGQNVGRAGVIKFQLTGDGLTTLWKFDPDERAAYSGEAGLTQGSGTGSGCADVWGSPAIEDPRTDGAPRLVFFGTGSCSDPDDADATGEHVWGIRLDTGALVWTQGPHGRDGVVDDDFGGAVNLLANDTVGAGSKDGWYYTFDRKTGAPGWAKHVGQWAHLTGGFAMGGVLASPATGKVNGEDAVFLATALSTPNDKPFEEGPDTTVPSVTEDPGRMFSLSAVRVSDGELLWRSAGSRQAFGAPTYVDGVDGGVVLVPSTVDFSMTAIDADSGLLLAKRPLPGPPSSAPTAVGDTVYGGIGTSVGEGSALAPASGVYAFQVVPPE